MVIRNAFLLHVVRFRRTFKACPYALQGEIFVELEIKKPVTNALEILREPLEIRQLHLRLDSPCIERGGSRQSCRGVLAEFLGSTIPPGQVFLCHACHNSGCSNARHLYWGTVTENTNDRWRSAFQRGEIDFIPSENKRPSRLRFTPHEIVAIRNLRENVVLLIEGNSPQVLRVSRNNSPHHSKDYV